MTGSAVLLVLNSDAVDALPVMAHPHRYAASTGMRFLNLLFLVSAICCAGCSAVGTRVVGGRYFSGVRGDYSMVFDRTSIDPDSRVHPALAVIDTPFSLVADILFLPYDAYQECTSSGSTNVVALTSSHE